MPVYYDLTPSLEGADPGDITAVHVAFLPVRDEPDATTTWVPVTYVAPTASFTVAGPDAGGAGRIVAPGSCDLHLRATAATWVRTIKLERVNVREGAALAALTPAAVSDAYVAGLIATNTATRAAL